MPCNSYKLYFMHFMLSFSQKFFLKFSSKFFIFFLLFYLITNQLQILISNRFLMQNNKEFSCQILQSLFISTHLTDKIEI